MCKELYLAIQYGDMDMEVTIGVGTDLDKAVKIIHQSYNPMNKKIVNLGNNKFKYAGSSDTDFIIRKIKSNKAI